MDADRLPDAMIDLLVTAMLAFAAVWFVIGMLIGDAGPEPRPRPRR